MMESMFEVPSRDDIKKVIVTKKAVEGDGEPVMVLKNQEESA